MARKNRFLDALTSRVLIGDGAMGTALHERGVSFDECMEVLNSSDRKAVREVHRDYLHAGADVIETNTFRGNRPHLERFGLADKVFEVNYRGARLARGVAGRHVFVAGSVGPLPRPGPSAPELEPEKRTELYAEQVSALAAGGVDFVLLETFTRVRDVCAAVAAVLQAAPELPVIAQMAFYGGHGSLGGSSIRRAVDELLTAGADGVGVNCGRGFADALAVIEQMARLTDAPLSAYPNAGLPDVREGKLVYDQPPEYMAEMAARMVDAGVNLIGGCCGTDSRHVEAIARQVRGRSVAPRARVAPATTPRQPVTAELRRPPPEGSFLERIGKEPLLVVELDPPRGLVTDKVIDGARRLRDAGVHLISMAENPLASVRMGNVGMASLVQRESHAEPLVHFTCRDRNTIGLHSDLMGAAALGIRHVLAVTGDPAGPKTGGVTSVYDVNSIGLVKILASLNAGRTSHGADIGRGAGFTVGVAFNPNFRTMDGQLERLARKADAGAHFALTQLVYDTERVGQIREATAPCGIPVLPGVMPFASYRNALFVRNEVPGVRVPDAVLARMEKHPTGDDARRVGLDIARELLAAAHASGAPGAYIVAPFNRTDLALELVEFVHARWGAVAEEPARTS